MDQPPAIDLLQAHLVQSARDWAASAMHHFLHADTPNYSFAVHHMAVAVEHLAKAYLASISPVLLVKPPADANSLLALLGRTDLTSKLLKDIETISGSVAIERCQQVLKAQGRACRPA